MWRIHIKLAEPMRLLKFTIKVFVALLVLFIFLVVFCFGCQHAYREESQAANSVFMDVRGEPRY